MTSKALFFIAGMGISLIGNSQNIELDWKVLNPLKNVWMEFGTKGSVQEAFLNAGELPDPFVGKNEDLYQWMENHQWQLTSRFELSEENFNNEFIEMNFFNVDTYAEIFLNDSLIGKTNNAFRPYHYDIKQFAKVGLNHVKVIFTSPVEYHKENYKNAKTRLPAPNDVNKIAIAPYSRKPQYQFGWDWSLRMNTMGFWKPVEIRTYDGNKIISKNIQIESVENKKAVVQFQIQTKAKLKEDLVWKSEQFGDFILKAGEDRFTRKISIDNPELWWPKGQGKQYLYSDKWILQSKNNTVIDEVDVRFGVRTSQLMQEKDEIGTSYEISVNGRPIFCKGGDYIPQDIFPARVTNEQIRKMVEDMEKANFNMVRVWGGGYYPDEYFFELCDEKGIMVWQDFMFACAMYLGDELFLANVKEEFDYQIPRISSHPSLVIFNGNNEVDVAWKNWGFQARYLIFGAEADKIEQDYKRLFQTFLPERVNYWSNTPYIHTSPLSNWGKDEYYDSGSQHYWGVWHGKDPIEDFGKKSGRFNAEYGFQSFPQMSTINTFASEKDLDLESDVMKAHQKSYVGNGMMLKHAKILYGQPKTFEQFVYYSQLTQAKAVGIAIASHRVQAPRCMGTLYWQINDCWSAPSWSSIDYFGNWKALHYQVKRDYEDIAMVEKIEELNKEQYFLVNSTGQSQDLDIQWQIYALDGSVLKEDSSHQDSYSNKSIQLANYLSEEGWAKNNFLVKFQVYENGEVLTERSFLHLPKKKKHSGDLKIVAKLIYNPAEKSGVLTLENTCFLNSLFISSKKNGVHFDNNLLYLLPGKHTISFQSEDLITIDDLVFEYL
jgi:beta-mannosidase